MKQSCIRITIVLLIAAILQFVSTRAAFGYFDKKDIIDGIRRKVVHEQTYEFGKEYSFVLKDEQAVLLRCLENPDGIDSVLICLTSDFIPDYGHDHGWSKMLFTYLLQGGQIIEGGGSPVPPNIGAIRGVGKAAAIAKWNANGGQIRGSFILTDDTEKATEKFTDLVKTGFISSTGNWYEKVDFDSMRLTPDEQVEGFVRLWSEIKYNFANFDLVPELDWDKALTEYLPRVRREQTLREYHRLLAECVSRLKDGHTDVSVRFCPLFDSAQPALEVQPVEGKAVITKIGQTSDVNETCLSRGEEIIQIDGRAVSEILEKDIYPYVFASTPQDRDLKAFPFLLRGPTQSKINLRIRDLAGHERNIQLTRQRGWTKHIPRERSKPVEYQDLGDSVAYVAINSFGSGDVVDEFDRIMKRIGKADGLVIDVRNNSGGNSAYGDAIISRLIERPVPRTLWKTPQHIAAFEAWGRPKKCLVGDAGTIEPRKANRYLGPLVILIGPETVSAAEDFVVPLHASGRATLVGEKTAGTTGQPLRFEFSHIIRGRVCTKRDTYPDGREYVGVGIIPDIKVHPTPADIAAGRDVVLEKGLDVLCSKIKQAGQIKNGNSTNN
ncbi:MAG: S41 family peptidase [Planctomycetota bacterium]|jgi:C-terminal processing protease CtpA/Prc